MNSNEPQPIHDKDKDVSSDSDSSTGCHPEDTLSITGSGADRPEATPAAAAWPREYGGPRGPEPTRYGDWEQKGRCSDF